MVNKNQEKSWVFKQHGQEILPAQPLDINTPHNVYVVEELIQLTVESEAEFIANSHWNEGFT